MLGEDDTLDRLSRSERQTARIEPLDDHLVVEPTDEDHETRSGLIIPGSSEISVRAGIVVAIGEDVQSIALGDKVIFPRAAGIEMRVAGEPVLLVRRSDLIARFAE
jgi:co-chaperonin GroES (HSP10)